MGSFSNQLFLYLQSVQSYIAPPIAAVFLFGIFNKRINSQGAMACLLTGFVLGLFMFVLQIIKESLSGLVLDFANINFLHFAILLFVICSSVLFVVSCLTPESVKSTYGVVYESKDRIKSEGSRQQVVLSVLLVVLIACIWIIFS